MLQGAREEDSCEKELLQDVELNEEEQLRGATYLVAEEEEQVTTVMIRRLDFSRSATMATRTLAQYGVHHH